MALYRNCPKCHHRQPQTNQTCSECGVEMALERTAPVVTGLIAATASFGLAAGFYKLELAMAGEAAGLFVAVFFAALVPVFIKAWVSGRPGGFPVMGSAAIGSVAGAIIFLIFAGKIRALVILSTLAVAIIGAVAGQVLARND